jgi:glycerophosphoryl diester phosphodiesterase
MHPISCSLTALGWCLIALLILPPTSVAFGAPDKADIGATGAVQVFAHRGGRKWAMAAFAKSVQAGVDGIELDIHRCKTGELVVIHDDTLERTSNGKGAVKDKTLAELRALDAGSWYGTEFKGERIPTLSEVLNLLNGKVVLNIEIKNLPTDYPGIEDELIKQLESYNYKDKIIISSFDHQVLRRLHDKAPQYRLAMLDGANLVDIGQYAQKVGARDWNPHSDCMRADTVANAHGANLKIFTWTVNDPTEWQRVATLGTDGIITDDPVGLMNWRKALTKK